MIQIQEGNICVWHSENTPYLRVDVTGLITPQQLQRDLSNARLWGLIAERSVKNVLINCSRLHRFGTEDLDWITSTWLHWAANTGIKKVSVVVAANVYKLFVHLLAAAAERATSGRIEIRFFCDSQFYDGWESISWFDE